MPGKVLEAKTFVSVLLFVSVHFLYSWLLPAVQGSKEAKGGIVKDILLCNRVDRIKRKGIRLRACSPCVIPFYSVTE